MHKEILGIILIVTGLFDAWKYAWQGQKIKQTKTAKGQSRKFLNAAIVNDGVRITYAIVISDIYILLSSLLAMSTMLYCYWITYLYYPFKKRGLINFKRPNVFLYIINSILPNSIRKRL